MSFNKTISYLNTLAGLAFLSLSAQAANNPISQGTDGATGTFDVSLSAPAVCNVSVGDAALTGTASGNDVNYSGGGNINLACTQGVSATLRFHDGTVDSAINFTGTKGGSPGSAHVIAETFGFSTATPNGTNCSISGASGTDIESSDLINGFSGVGLGSGNTCVVPYTVSFTDINSLLNPGAHVTQHTVVLTIS